ncbi:MAG TPA: addiction module protein [Candidatus Hydrogenedentes bacterium]|nr:addiction module protein [Candidatus Hydrogenedentota bacterium]
MSLTQIEDEALKLTEQERAILAERLLDSLDGDSAGLNEERWLDEAERRYRAYKAGQLSARPAEEVFRDAYRCLK